MRRTAISVRSDNSLTGAGITVGVLSDSYDCYPVYAANGVNANGPNGYANNGFNTTAAQDIDQRRFARSVNVLEEADLHGIRPAYSAALRR